MTDRKNLKKAFQIWTIRFAASAFGYRPIHQGAHPPPSALMQLVMAFMRTIGSLYVPEDEFAIDDSALSMTSAASVLFACICQLHCKPSLWTKKDILLICGETRLSRWMWGAAKTKVWSSWRQTNSTWIIQIYRREVIVAIMANRPQSALVPRSRLSI
jgi:hypothetical protein